MDSATLRFALVFGDISVFVEVDVCRTSSLFCGAGEVERELDRDEGLELLRELFLD